MPPSPLCGHSLDPPSDPDGHRSPRQGADAAPWGMSEQSYQQPKQEAGTFPSHVYMSYGCRLVAKEVVSLATGKQGLPRQAGETGGALRQEKGGEVG